ncbi:CD48 antigen isoform 1-T1 [Molossus nigricans]
MCSKGLKWCLALQLLLLPHCFLETSIQGHSEKKVFAVSGSNVSLKISDLPDNPQRFTWFYTRNQKILEWESNNSSPYYFKTKFKGRVTFDHQDGVLYICNVHKDDSSTYILKVLKDGLESTWTIPLKVFDPVPKPVIKIKKIQKVNNSCHLILLCVILDQPVNCTWYGDSGLLPENLQRNALEITVMPENYSKFYTCQVRNPVSDNNDTISFTSACQLAQSSGVAWTAEFLVVMIPTIVGLLWI